MSEIKIITDGGRRRWIPVEKLRIVEQTLDGREGISVMAQRNGMVPQVRKNPTFWDDGSPLKANLRPRERNRR